MDKLGGTCIVHCYYIAYTTAMPPVICFPSIPCGHRHKQCPPPKPILCYMQHHIKV